MAGGGAPPPLLPKVLDLVGVLARTFSAELLKMGAFDDLLSFIRKKVRIGGSSLGTPRLATKATDKPTGGASAGPSAALLEGEVVRGALQALAPFSSNSDCVQQFCNSGMVRTLLAMIAPFAGVFSVELLGQPTPDRRQLLSLLDLLASISAIDDGAPSRPSQATIASDTPNRPSLATLPSDTHMQHSHANRPLFLPLATIRRAISFRPSALPASPTPHPSPPLLASTCTHLHPPFTHSPRSLTPCPLPTVMHRYNMPSPIFTYRYPPHLCSLPLLAARRLASPRALRRGHASQARPAVPAARPAAHRRHHRRLAASRGATQRFYPLARAARP